MSTVKTILVFFFIALTLNVFPQTDALVEAAQNVTKEDGGYTFSVLLLTAMLIISTTVNAYLYKEDGKKNQYIMNITKEAITAVSGIESILSTVKQSQDRLESDHEKIKDGIIDIKSSIK